MSRTNQSLKLSEARELTPAVNPVEAMRRQLAVALFGGVSEKDVLAVATKLKEMALAGDHKAMQMFFKLLLPQEAKPAAPPAEQAGLQMVAEALRDLVDEIRVGKAREGKRRPKPVTAEANGGGGPPDLSNPKYRHRLPNEEDE